MYLYYHVVSSTGKYHRRSRMTAWTKLILYVVVSVPHIQKKKKEQSVLCIIIHMNVLKIVLSFVYIVDGRLGRDTVFSSEQSWRESFQ